MHGPPAQTALLGLCPLPGGRLPPWREQVLRLSQEQCPHLLAWLL